MIMVDHYLTMVKKYWNDVDGNHGIAITTLGNPMCW